MTEKKTKTATITMLETHRVVYEVEVEEYLTENQVAEMANRLIIDLDDGQFTGMPDWDCVHVDFEV